MVIATFRKAILLLCFVRLPSSSFSFVDEDRHGLLLLGIVRADNVLHNSCIFISLSCSLSLTKKGEDEAYNYKIGPLSRKGHCISANLRSASQFDVRQFVQIGRQLAQNT